MLLSIIKKNRQQLEILLMCTGNIYYTRTQTVFLCAILHQYCKSKCVALWKGTTKMKLKQQPTQTKKKEREKENH
jgi:hypothetical protein